MAELSNKARVGEAFDLLAAGLEPFVAQHMKATTPKGKQWAANFVATGRNPDREYSTTDPSFLLNVIIECWTACSNGSYNGDQTCVHAARQAQRLGT
jgi:hypothetical protein